MPPPGSRFFHFHAVFGKKYAKLIPTWELASAPPQENPGSATVSVMFLLVVCSLTFYTHVCGVMSFTIHLCFSHHCCIFGEAST